MNPGLFRLFLAVVVVIHHSFPLRLGAWAVGMFFALSGFWISRMWRANYSQKAFPYRTFLISRWWRIAPLFVVVQVIAACLVWTGFHVGDGSALNDWRWWATQPTVIGSTQFERLLPPSWSLDVEMQFYVVAPLILMGAIRLVGNWRLAMIVCLLICWCIWRLMRGATLETPKLDVFLWLFLSGVWCETSDWRPTRMMATGSGVTLIGIILILCAVPVTRSLIWVRGSDPSTDTSTIWVATTFVVFCAVSLPMAIRTVHHPSGKWDRWLGDLSFPLYLFHWIPRDWYYANVDWSLGPVRNGGLLVANVMIAFSGAVLLLQAIDRPVQKFRQAWVRQRSEK